MDSSSLDAGLFQDFPGGAFWNVFAMTPNRKICHGDRTVKNVVPRTIAQKLAAMIFQDFQKLGSFHFFTAVLLVIIYGKRVYGKYGQFLVMKQRCAP